MKTRINIYKKIVNGCALLLCLVAFWGFLYFLFDKYLFEIKNHVEIYVITVINLFALCVAYIAVAYTRRVNETLKISDFNRRYSSDEVLHALRLLREVSNNWKKDENNAPLFNKRECCHGVFLSETAHILICKYCRNACARNPRGAVVVRNQDHFISSTERNLPWTEAQDSARRKIKFFYIDALTLYLNRSISKEAFLEIIDMDGITLLFEVVEPMEALLNEHYHWEPFFEIMRATNADFWGKKNDQTEAHVKTKIFRNEQ